MTRYTILDESQLNGPGFTVILLSGIVSSLRVSRIPQISHLGLLHFVLPEGGAAAGKFDLTSIRLILGGCL